MDVEIEFEGRVIKGFYSASNRMITVPSAQGSKTTQLGCSAAHPEVLAKVMLRELAQERKA